MITAIASSVIPLTRTTVNKQLGKELVSTRCKLFIKSDQGDQVYMLDFL